MKGALPLPVTLGGSTVTSERQAGPPSKMFPLLRDIGENANQYDIFIEIDTEQSRIRGQVLGIYGGRASESSGLIIRDPDTVRNQLPDNYEDWTFERGGRRIYTFNKIIAHRLIAVVGEVPPRPTPASKYRSGDLAAK